VFERPNDRFVSFRVSWRSNGQRLQPLRSGFPRTEAPLSPVAIRRADERL